MKNLASTPSLEELLAHSGWVRALARSLVADSSAADDVEQQVWLTAMERPPRHSSNLKAWLSSVVRSVVGRNYRDSERQERRRRKLSAGLHGASGSVSGHGQFAGDDHGDQNRPEAVASRMETFQALAALVSELEEPYGSAIYLRYFENMSVAEVARQQGVPTATAQTRLHRGVEKLRGRMKARFGLDWKQRCVIFLAPLPAAPIPVTTIALITMSAKTKWMIAAAVLLALPLYQIFSAETDVNTTSGVELATPVAAENDPVQGQVNVELLANGRVETSIPDSSAAGSGDVGGGHQLTVSHAGSLQPAANVEVFYFDRGSDLDKEFSRTMFRDNLDMESLLERFGSKYSTDASGRVTLPARTSYAWVAARSADKFASLYMLEDLNDNHYEEIELLLEARVNIAVRVLDHLGQPAADVSIAYQSQYAPGHGNNLDLVKTDESGRAIFRNMQVRFASANPNNGHFIVVDLPLANSLQHKFPLQDPPLDEIVFHLPETTSMNVRASNADGTPLRDGAPVKMHADYVHIAGTEKGAVGSFDLKTSQQASISYVRQGVAHFPRVGLDLEVVVGARFPGTSEFRIAHGRTSERPDVISEIELIGASAGTRYQTMVLGHDSMGLANTVVDMEFFILREEALLDPAVTQKQYSLRTTTNANSELNFIGEPGNTYAMLVNADQVAGFVEWGLLHIPNDVGGKLKDTTLGEKLILQGVVKNADGSPLPGAAISLALPWVPSIHGNELQPWEYQYLSTLSDATGTFTIRGTLQDPTGFLGWANAQEDVGLIHLSIAPSADANPQEYQSFAFQLGQSGQVFQLQKKASVAGRIQLDDAISSEMLRLELHHTTAASSAEAHRYAPLERKSGKFHYPALEAGTATLQLRTAITNEWVATSQPFDIKPGKNCVPADWQVVDLRGKLFLHQVYATNQNGEALAQARMSFQHNTSVRFVERTMPIQFVTTQPQSIIRLSADGYQTSPILVVGERHTEALASAIALQVTLPQGVKPPSDGSWQMLARLKGNQITSIDTWLPPSWGRWSDSQQSFEMQLPGAGEWEFAISFRGLPNEPMSAQGPTMLVQLASGLATITKTITSGQGAAEFTVPVTQEAFQTVLKAAQADRQLGGN